MSDPDLPEHDGATADQVILSVVKPGMEAGYCEWTARMQEAQSHYPGYRGMYHQAPGVGGTHWISIVRYATSDQLNAWLASAERAAMLEEARNFIEGEELLRLATSFPGWVPVDPRTGQGPPDWKTAMLVLLGLYPIVAVEMLYLSPRLTGLPPSIGVFIGNVLSVSATSFLTMPFLVRSFDRWLFSGPRKDRRGSRSGLAVVIALFALDIGFVTILFRLQTG